MVIQPTKKNKKRKKEVVTFAGHLDLF